MNIPSRPCVREDLIYRQIDEDFVIYDPIRDFTAQFNFTAAFVLDLCDGSRSFDEICRAVSEAFSMPVNRIDGDVLQTLKDLCTMEFFKPEEGAG